jgi:hypothetical protein
MHDLSSIHELFFRHQILMLKDNILSMFLNYPSHRFVVYLQLIHIFIYIISANFIHTLYSFISLSITLSLNQYLTPQINFI